MMVGTIIGTLAIVLITVVIGVFLDRKVGLLPRAADLAENPAPKPVTMHAAGEAPATAIRARGGQLDRLRSQRCPGCRGPMTNAHDDTVRYNERELVVLHFACGACGTRRSLYVEQLG